MKDAKSLLLELLVAIPDGEKIAPLFAEDGVVELGAAQKKPLRAVSRGLLARSREISVCTRLRGGAERTRTACQPRSRYRTDLRPGPSGGFSVIKCR
jgi:hypothetical protein